MKGLSILIGKMALVFGRALGRGSSLPGYLGLRIDKNLLKGMKTPPTVVVTGTNGKTTVSHFLAEILGQTGDVIHNREGSNMPQGIATLLIENSSLFGKVRGDYAVLEVDEGFLRLISQALEPDYGLITNLFDDQVDRFGSARELASKLIGSYPKSTRLLVNADDPNCYWLSLQYPDSKVKYFGVGENVFSKKSKDYDEVDCPSCNKTLDYKIRFYDSLGYYSCECGFERPKVDYLLESVDREGGYFTINSETYHSIYNQDYMLYNLLAAIGQGLEIGLTTKNIRPAIEDYYLGEGRLEFFDYHGYKSFLNLVKNTAGMDRSIDYINSLEGSYNLLLAINNNSADGEDFSWFEKSAFERLNSDRIGKIYITGGVREEIKEVLVKKGFKAQDLVLGQDADSLLKILGEGRTYFLTNYTAMAPLRRALGLVEK